MRSLMLALAMLLCWLQPASTAAAAETDSRTSEKSRKNTEIAKKQRQVARARARAAANYRKAVPRKYRPKNYKPPKYKWSSKGPKRAKAPKRR
jgi:hypothetical protein